MALRQRRITHIQLMLVPPLCPLSHGHVEQVNSIASPGTNEELQRTLRFQHSEVMKMTIGKSRCGFRGYRPMDRACERSTRLDREAETEVENEAC